ncbi:site-2 protease family protein [uncultured Methanobrevibacter sp.]|uniref:site-2 protease family protein n=1 Tax=uncultured Methanobrevibacter sp. TaxID=253161 RepID=UPI0025EB467E|nr:site-2 protease family protein [uncultured Methanobrevibacter sp.]
MLDFTKEELRNLTIAFVVLTFCFGIATAGLNAHGIISILPIVVVSVVIGSLLHELGHKFVAMKYGCQAEFKLWPLGLLIAVITSFFGFVFASPGSLYIGSENLSDEINGKISIAGPMANMVLALIFLAIAALIYPLKIHSNIFHLIYLISTVGFSVNCFLATFNLFPIYSLDGTKVLKWNVGIWIAAIAIAGIMMFVSIAIGAENAVQLIMGV